MSALLGIVVMLVLAAVVILIVSKLGLGLEVTGFGAAFIAAAVIAIVSGVVWWLLVDVLNMNLGAGFWGALIYLIIAAVVLMVSDKFVKGMKVNGFVGAIVAAIAIGVVSWLVNWVLSLLFM